MVIEHPLFQTVLNRKCTRCHKVSHVLTCSIRIGVEGCGPHIAYRSQTHGRHYAPAAVRAFRGSNNKQNVDSTLVILSLFTHVIFHAMFFYSCMFRP
jgi:hypothetical protein